MPGGKLQVGGGSIRLMSGKAVVAETGDPCCCGEPPGGCTASCPTTAAIIMLADVVPACTLATGAEFTQATIDKYMGKTYYIPLSGSNQLRDVSETVEWVGCGGSPGTPGTSNGEMTVSLQFVPNINTPGQVLDVSAIILSCDGGIGGTYFFRFTATGTYTAGPNVYANDNLDDGANQGTGGTVTIRLLTATVVASPNTVDVDNGTHSEAIAITVTDCGDCADEWVASVAYDTNTSVVGEDGCFACDSPFESPNCWVAIDATNGFGNGTINISIEANTTGDTRTAQVLVNDEIINITQDP